MNSSSYSDLESYLKGLEQQIVNTPVPCDHRHLEPDFDEEDDESPEDKSDLKSTDISDPLTADAFNFVTHDPRRDFEEEFGNDSSDEELLCIQRKPYRLDLSRKIQPSPRCLQMYHEVNFLLASGLTQKALDICDVAVEEFPGADVYCKRAHCHLLMANFSKAEEDCSKAIKLDYRFATAYIRRGIAQKFRQEFNGAYRDFQTALLLRPNKLVFRKDCLTLYDLAQKQISRQLVQEDWFNLKLLSEDEPGIFQSLKVSKNHLKRERRTQDKPGVKKNKIKILPFSVPVTLLTTDKVDRLYSTTVGRVVNEFHHLNHH